MNDTNKILLSFLFLLMAIGKGYYIDDVSWVGFEKVCREQAILADNWEITKVFFLNPIKYGYENPQYPYTEVSYLLLIMVILGYIKNYFFQIIYLVCIIIVGVDRITKKITKSSKSES